MASRARQRQRPRRPRTRAIAHFERTGCILPGHQGEIASYLADHNHTHD